MVAPAGRHHGRMRSVVARVGASAATVGLLVVVTGTFLPWLRSGSVLRDSYQSVGALRDLIGGGVPDAVLNAWLFVIPVCVLTVALYALRLRRTSAVICCVVSIAMAAAAILIVAQGSGPDGLIGVSASGPTVTLIGAVVALIGAVMVLATPIGRATD